MSYKIVDSHEIPPVKEELPRHLLGHSLQEAEKVYNTYSGLLNTLAYNYHAATGIDKSDLFAEAVRALAWAKVDFDIKRSSDFVIYAVYRIKDALNEYVRKNTVVVTIPSYLNKASYIYDRLRHTLENSNVSMDVCMDILSQGTIENDMGVSDKLFDVCDELLTKLHSAAARAEIDYRELLDRIHLLPEEKAFHDNIIVNEEENFNSILVGEIMDNLTEEEKVIAEGIMNDRTYKDIGYQLGKSDAWVSKKMDGIKEKIKKRVSWE